EFFESAMVPQIMLNGFLGFAPRADGFKLDPRLPKDWPELTVDRIRFQNLVMRIRATNDTIEITKEGALTEPPFLQLPEGDWKATLLGQDGSPLREARLRKRDSDGALRLNWGDAAAVRLVKANAAPARTPAEREAFFRAQTSKSSEFRATWIHSAFGIEGWDWDRTVATLKTNGFNAIIPNLLWAGAAYYPSKILPVSPKVAEQGDQVAECLKACRKYGIEMHVWK